MNKPYPPIGYGDYLQIEGLLNLQHPRSDQFKQPAHDEMLFIIIHQTYELWFKQILTELDSVLSIFEKDEIDESNLSTATSRLGRVIEIQRILIDQVNVLETMTPMDFLEFRDFLFPASGFQSVQFRVIENKLGLPRTSRLPFNALPYTAYVKEAEKKIIEESEVKPSIFERLEKWLERTPFIESAGFQFWQHYGEAVEKMFDQDRKLVEMNKLLTPEEKQKNLASIDANLESFKIICDEKRYNEVKATGSWRMSFRALQAALLINLYRDQPILHLPFRILTALQDIDEGFATWRYRHALMAQRMLGSKIGTGGSSGHRYLKAATDQHRIYSDLVNLATFFIPRSALPALPASVTKNLGFFYGTSAPNGNA